MSSFRDFAADPLWEMHWLSKYIWILSLRTRRGWLVKSSRYWTDIPPKVTQVKQYHFRYGNLITFLQIRFKTQSWHILPPQVKSVKSFFSISVPAGACISWPSLLYFWGQGGRRGKSTSLESQHTEIGAWQVRIWVRICTMRQICFIY